MKYPYNLLSEHTKVFPLFGDQLKGYPLIIDMSSSNPILDTIDVSDQKLFQEIISNLLTKNNAEWGISGYLEYRKSLLKNYPQMVDENRFYHLGIDIVTPVGYRVYAPLDGEVVSVNYEKEKGSYGHYVVLKHKILDNSFYSLCGHLSHKTLPKVGDFIKSGESFAQIGDFEDNGFWFHHIHLQVLTEKGYQEGFVSKGYCSHDMLPEIQDYCPQPAFLFRY